MWWEEYDNKLYTHEFRIGSNWYPCYKYHKLQEEEGYTTILCRNRTLNSVKNDDLREIIR